MARVDPHAIHQDAADAHPEWIAVDKDGNPRRHWAYPGSLGDLRLRRLQSSLHAEGASKEIMRDYDIDAIFANRWQGHGVCYCDACTERFKRAPRATSCRRTPTPKTRSGRPGTRGAASVLTG